MDRATVEHLRPPWTGVGRHPRHRRPADARPRPSPAGWCRPASASTSGCGAGRYLPHLGAPVVAFDASVVMLEACRDQVPDALYVQGDVEHLPFARGPLDGAWSWMTHLHVPRAPAAPGPLGPAPGLRGGQPVRDPGAGGRRTRAPTSPATRSAVGSSPGGSRTGWWTWSPAPDSRWTRDRSPSPVTRSDCGPCGPAPWPTRSGRACAC